MKKTLLLVVFCISFLTINAQEQNTLSKENQKKYELKINAAYLLAGAFDVYYEKIINEESAYGISLLVSFSDSGGNIGDIYKYMITPYYRFYFGKKYSAGFFAEGFGSLNRSRETYLFSSADEYNTDFALGIGIGGKWITKRGIIFEIFSSYGRNLFANDDNGNEFITRGGISVGYRF